MSNYFSDMVNQHQSKSIVYQVVTVPDGKVLKETKDVAIAELTKQDYLFIGWSVEVKPVTK